MKDKIGNFILRNFHLSTKFRLFLLILISTVLVQTSNAIPLPASDQRLSLHTQQYRERRYQQLLQEQRSLVVPTPHRHHLHHRSVGIMPQTNSKTNSNGNDVGDYCKAITATKGLIELACRQANATYDNLHELLETYTDVKHGENLKDFYTQWTKHKLNLEHPYTKFLDRDINVKPNTNALPQHLRDQKITDELLSMELLNIHQTLRILESFHEKISEFRNKNKERISADMRRENETDEQFQNRLAAIDKVYENINHLLQQDLTNAANILETLKIQPQNNFEVSYNTQEQQIEWLLFQEHLSIMKYLIEVYTYLMNLCGTAS